MKSKLSLFVLYTLYVGLLMLGLIRCATAQSTAREIKWASPYEQNVEGTTVKFVQFENVQHHFKRVF